MPPIDILRTRAQYRIDIELDIAQSFDVLGRRLAEALEMFAPTELRVTPEGVALFVCLPEGVTVETLDEKAEALRARWRE
jgi:hypothetical protein